MVQSHGAEGANAIKYTSPCASGPPDSHADARASATQSGPQRVVLREAQSRGWVGNEMRRQGHSTACDVGSPGIGNGSAARDSNAYLQ